MEGSKRLCLLALRFIFSRHFLRPCHTMLVDWLLQQSDQIAATGTVQRERESQESRTSRPQESRACSEEFESGGPNSFDTIRLQGQLLLDTWEQALVSATICGFMGVLSSDSERK